MPRDTRRGPDTLWILWGSLLGCAVLQLVLLVIIFTGTTHHTWVTKAELSAVGLLVLVVGITAGRQIAGLKRRLLEREREHVAALDQVAQLEAHNMLLQIVARSVDTALAFQALARRIAGIVPCDRVGLALLQEDGRTFQTYTARVAEEERRSRPRPELQFGMERTMIGRVVRAQEPLLQGDLAEIAVDCLDANVLYSAGFKSILLVPLISKGRTVGTLNVVSRTPHAFVDAQAVILRPIAVILAVAYVVQQLQLSLGRFRTMEVMSELTLSISTEINGALQTIIGHCDLLEHEYSDPALQRDLATVVRQAQRIASLLEKMRTVANERLQAAADTVNQTAIPSSPEEIEREEI